MRIRLLAALFCLVPAAAFAQAPCPAVKPMRFEVASQVRRSAPAFTQGLEYRGGALYESSGNVVGTSRVQRIDPKSGKVTMLQDGGNAYFGEGLTILDGRIWQLTWREGRVFQRDLAGRQLREFKNPRDGWGIAQDGKRLIVSDGSDRLYFHSPRDFSTLGSVQVRGPNGGVFGLNELEYVKGEVWANIFTTWQIVKIAPETGCVDRKSVV